eukprot:10009631-Prorocentrum_lima.AAC.1
MLSKARALPALEQRFLHDVKLVGVDIDGAGASAASSPLPRASFVTSWRLFSSVSYTHLRAHETRRHL